MENIQSTKSCAFCAEKILADARKCKHCGEFLDKTAQPPSAYSAESTPLRKMPYWKALLHCIGIGFMLMVVSMVILFPLLFLGMLLIVTSPIMAFFILEGDCPYCGNKLVIVPPKTTVKCRSCKQRSSLRDMRLIPLKTFVQVKG